MFSLRRIALLVVALAALWAASCNANPTVPVPPPEFCSISSPDADGMCEVGCEEGYTDRDVALVYNEQWGHGVMEATEQDGSFLAWVEAEVGDSIIVQLKHDNELSAEVALQVPAP
jgi:hypothetical protein